MFNFLKAVNFVKVLNSWSNEEVVQYWIPNPVVLGSKPLAGCKVNSAFHPAEVDQLSARNSWELNGKK